MKRYGKKRNWVVRSTCPCCRINHKSHSIRKTFKKHARRLNKKEIKEQANEST